MIYTDRRDFLKIIGALPFIKPHLDILEQPIPWIYEKLLTISKQIELETLQINTELVINAAVLDTEFLTNINLENITKYLLMPVTPDIKALFHNSNSSTTFSRRTLLTQKSLKSFNTAKFRTPSPEQINFIRITYGRYLRARKLQQIIDTRIKGANLNLSPGQNHYPELNADGLIGDYTVNTIKELFSLPIKYDKILTTQDAFKKAIFEELNATEFLELLRFINSAEMKTFSIQTSPELQEGAIYRKQLTDSLYNFIEESNIPSFLSNLLLSKEKKKDLSKLSLDQYKETDFYKSYQHLLEWIYLERQKLSKTQDKQLRYIYAKELFTTAIRLITLFYEGSAYSPKRGKEFFPGRGPYSCCDIVMLLRDLQHPSFKGNRDFICNTTSQQIEMVAKKSNSQIYSKPWGLNTLRYQKAQDLNEILQNYPSNQLLMLGVIDRLDGAGHTFLASQAYKHRASSLIEKASVLLNNNHSPLNLRNFLETILTPINQAGIIIESTSGASLSTISLESLLLRNIKEIKFVDLLSDKFIKQWLLNND